MPPVNLPRPLLTLLVAALCGVAALPAPVAAAEAGPAAAGVTRIVVGGIKSGLIPELSKGGVPESVIACIRAIDEDDFEASVRDLFAATLTDDEARTFDMYMASPVGQRELAVTLADAAEPGAAPVAPLTADERVKVAEFQRSAVGRKFATALKASVDDSETPGTIGHRMNDVLSECLE
jgi:hypothetical protein